MARNFKYRLYDTTRRAGESDSAYYKRLAKTVDTRMDRLVKLSNEKGYENVLKFAYANIKRDRDALGLKRFEVKAPTDKRVYNARINMFKKFLESPTSSKGNIKKVYDKRIESYKQRYGITLKWDQVEIFFQSEAYEKMSNAYADSKTTMAAIGIMQESRDLNKSIEEILKKHEFTADGLVSKRIDDVIRKQGLSLEDFIK